MQIRYGRAAAVMAVSALAMAGLATTAAATETVEGSVVEVVTDSEDGSTREQVLVGADGSIMPLDARVAVGVEAHAAVEATVVGDDVRAVEVVEPAAAAEPATPTAHHAYVVTIADASASGSVALADAEEITAEAADYWVREARGAISTFPVAGTAELTWTGSCATDYSAIWNTAKGRFPGVDFADEANHLIVFSPTGCDYDYGGKGVLGASIASGGMIHMALDSTGILVHELGHNLSLGHSNLDWPGGYPAEYYGAFGPQGFGFTDDAQGGVDAAYRTYLDLPGWEDTTLEIDLTAAEGSTQTVTLHGTTTDVGTTAVMLVDDSIGLRCFVEYRHGADADADTFYAKTADYHWWLALDSYDVFYRPGIVVSDSGGEDLLVLGWGSGDDVFASYDEGETFAQDGIPFEVTVTELTGTTATVEIVTHAVEAEPIVFSDISDDVADARYTSFFGEISWLAAQGVSRGWANGDGTYAYRPYAPITRDAMAAFLYRLAAPAGYVPPAESPFVDVAVSDAFYTEIAWLAEQGVSTGWATAGGREYRPFAAITRDAMAAFLYRFAGEPAYVPEGGSPFVDVSSDQAFATEMAWLADEGISTGWTTAAGREYRPFAAITRDAMAAFLFRFSQG